MADNLLEKVRTLKVQNRNFAYFCKFRDEKRMVGEETLITGTRVLESRDTSILRNIKNITPVIVSFSLVNSIFKARAKEGIFPPILLLVPETMETGKFMRMEQEHFSPLKEDREDSELEMKIMNVRERIRNGEALQVVISRDFGPINLNPVDSLESFLYNDKSMYIFYFKFNEYEIFGSSPENLITREGKDLMIEPIAGTRTVSSNVDENERIAIELMNDPKELLEHRMLVDLARNDLGKISEYGSIVVSKSMEIRHFSSVMHIVSRVNSRLREGIGNDQIINAVFPAGTVSGAPKDRAIRIINEIEDTPRGPYAGCLGIMDRENMDMALTIRTIYGNGKGYFVRSGAGIVKDSIPEREVNEIRMKSFAAAGGKLNEPITN
ncbi:MAG: chorismate-binding protein [Cuniculiplasma sp.]